MYPKDFKDIVKQAVKLTKAYYNDDNLKKENPYYIGFGNPSAKILIVGQEMAISTEEHEQIRCESIENPNQWYNLIAKNITDFNFRFYENGIFKNPLHPYDGKPKHGNTWNQYQKLIQLVYPELSELKVNNSFLLKSFITEVNHEVSTTSMGNQRNDERANLTTHAFYSSFPITILAIGNYFTKAEIESIYNVNFQENLSESQRRLLVYENHNQGRILIQTRQMSNFFFSGEQRDKYFSRISERIKNLVDNY